MRDSIEGLREVIGSENLRPHEDLDIGGKIQQYVNPEVLLNEQNLMGLTEEVRHLIRNVPALIARLEGWEGSGQTSLQDDIDLLYLKERSQLAVLPEAGDLVIIPTSAGSLTRLELCNANGDTIVSPYIHVPESLY